LSGPRESRREDLYLPFTHRPAASGVAVVTLGEGDADRRLDLFRSSLQRAFPDTGFRSVRTMRQEIVERSAAPASMGRVIGLLGLIVFVVAMGGLYGLMSYLATMRRREMGIRKALGATSGALCRMLVRESSPMLGAGVGLGVVAGLMIGSLFVRSPNFRLLDPVAIGGVATFLYAAGLVGAIAPYLRTLREVTARLRD
jgi:ABC-type antimicrobial peptide transport system permease subunit